jgi:hypothetical protein
MDREETSSKDPGPRRFGWGSKSCRASVDQQKLKQRTRRWWLIPVILATQEAEIRRIMVQSQPGQIVCKTLSQKYLL